MYLYIKLYNWQKVRVGDEKLLHKILFPFPVEKTSITNSLCLCSDENEEKLSHMYYLNCVAPVGEQNTLAFLQIQGNPKPAWRYISGVFS